MKNVSKKHQIRIARDTLRMSDIGAVIMGGMTKEYAREILGPVESRKIELIEIQNDEAPEPDRAGCGDFIRIEGTNGGGMHCGGYLTELDGNRSQHFCPACAGKVTT
jgi:hypothetical protein